MAEEVEVKTEATDEKIEKRPRRGRPPKRKAVAAAAEGTAETGVSPVQDVGVAGPQRLIAKLPLVKDADAIVVAAGMEGALPSVVGGYVSAPIIAVPTSVGYGAAFGGIAAMLGMMNSCASNVTVVNIDAGFKAGYVAGLIAKRVGMAVRRALENAGK